MINPQGEEKILKCLRVIGQLPLEGGGSSKATTSCSSLFPN